MAKYKLTNKASEDLSNLYEYGFTEFGEETTDEYFDGIVQKIEDLAESPLLGRSVNELKKGCRLGVFRNLSIYYFLSNKDTVIIVRILRGQDPKSSV